MSLSNAGMTTGGYEFSTQENVVIRRTAGACRAWGIFAVVIGGFTLLEALLTKFDAEGMMIIAELGNGIVSIIVGVVFVMTAGSLTAVVDTETNDIAHMMVAMKKLTIAFIVQIVAVLIGMVIGFAAGIVSAT